MDSNNVLVGCPTYCDHIIKWAEKFIKHHSKYDIMLVDNTWDSKAYFNILSEMMSHHSNLVSVMYHKWNPHQTWYKTAIVDCWQIILDYALNHGYTHFLWTAPDIFMEDGGGIQELLNHHKEYIGYPVNFGTQSGPPSVYKSGGATYSEELEKLVGDHYTWQELHKSPPLIRCYGSIGYSLIDLDMIRRTGIRFNRARFGTYKDGNLLITAHRGEDLMFLDALNQAKVECWVDTTHQGMNYTNQGTYIMEVRKLYMDGLIKGEAKLDNPVIRKRRGGCD